MFVCGKVCIFIILFLDIWYVLYDMLMLSVVMVEFFILVVLFYEKDKNIFCYDFWKVKVNGI